MRIRFQLNSRNHPARVGNFFATGGIAISQNRRAHLWELAKIEWLQIFKKSLIVHRQNRQVAIASDKFHLGYVGPGILISVNDDLLGPAHHMGVGHNSFPLDYEPGSTCPLD